MNILRNNKAIICIFVIALVVRLFLLGRFPYGFHEDEIKVGWNAYSILKTGKDDLGNKFALYYNTFGDYRPTGIFYVTIPSLILFGLTQFAVRFPSAFFGALTIFPVYFLALHVQRRKAATRKRAPALLSALFIAVTPWHVFISRATSEAVICLFFALCGLCLLVLALEKGKVSWFVASFVSVAISTLLYHMVRPLLPLFVFTILFYYWQYISHKSRKYGLIFCIIISLFSVLLLSSKASRGRFDQVSISKYQEKVLGVHTSKLEIPTEIKNEYVKYLGLDFLTGDSPKPYRYRVFGVGLVSLAVIAFFFCGIVTIAERKTSMLPLFLFLLSPLPAAVTGEDAPNLHRALFMLPFLVIIAGFGAYYLWHNGFFKRLLFLILFGVFVLSTLLSSITYFTTGAMDAAPYRNFGAKGVAENLIQYERDFANIIVSDDPDPLYPWYAFLAKKDPTAFNAQAIKREKGDWKYESITFAQNKCPSGDFLSDKKYTGKILIVDSPFCDIQGIKLEHPTVKLELFPIVAPKESQYHFWERME